MFRKTLLMLAAFLLFGSSQALPQEADSITIAIPGKGTIRVPALISITVDTVHDTTIVEVPVEVPCPDCPPPPEWECPEGWTCTPPPEPEPVVLFLREGDGPVAPGDQIVAELVMDSAEVERTRNVEFSANGQLVRTENISAYCLGGGDVSPCAPWTVPSDLTGTLELKAVRSLKDGSPSETYTLEIPVNPSTPPEPPDSTPPTPPDTTPTPPDSVGPTPGDTIIGQIPLGTPQNIRLVRDDSCWNSASGMTGTCHRIEFDPIPEDTVQTCVSCGTWWERMAVVNDDSVIGDEIYYAVGAWSGSLPYNPAATWQVGYEHELATTSWMIPQSMYPLPDTLSICVGAVAWDARSYEGPGGAKRYCGETSAGWQCSDLYPISETNCTTLTGS